MSALGDLYNIWGYPRPVGLIPRECCGGVDVSAIADAVIDAIGGAACDCACLSEKIDEAKEEIIETVKENCCHCHDDDGDGGGCNPCDNSCGIEIYEGDGTSVDLNELVGNHCFCRN